MENQPLISVIVPIYKVEKYLDRCVGSIVNQTYRNLEIILVDDGSLDNCPKICDDWAQKDHRIKVLHLVNGGAGKARNIGISQASGEWTVLVDGDDYLHNGMIEYLYNLIDSGVDLSECCIVNTFSDEADFSKITDKDEVITSNAEKALDYLIGDRIFRQTPPNKLYKTAIIQSIPFPEGNLIDDEFWTYKVIGECNQLKHSSLKLYAYRQQEGSVMHKSYSVKRLQALDAKNERLQYLQNHYPSLVTKAKIDYLTTCIYQGQMSIMYLHGNEKKEAKTKIKQSFDNIELTKEEKKRVIGSQRLWFALAHLSLFFTCKIKNTLKIGL